MMQRNGGHTTWNSVFSADVLEFVNNSVRFCSLLEQPQEGMMSFARELQTVLSTLYGKGLLLSGLQGEDESVLEEYVTEEQYNEVRSRVASVMGAYDDYLDVFVEEMKYSDKPVLRTVSEDVADIYQALANFVYAYRQGADDIKYAALMLVLQQFAGYWGGRSLSAMRALHELLFNMEDDEE